MKQPDKASISGRELPVSSKDACHKWCKTQPHTEKPASRLVTSVTLFSRTLSNPNRHALLHRIRPHQLLLYRVRSSCIGNAPIRFQLIPCSIISKHAHMPRICADFSNRKVEYRQVWLGIRASDNIGRMAHYLKHIAHADATNPYASRFQLASIMPWFCIQHC